MRFITRFFLALAFLSISNTGQPNSGIKEQGKVIGIVDGDTIDCLVNSKTIRVRLNAIDAPEKKQDYYIKSKQALAGLCYGKNVIMVEHGHDRYKRLIADLYVNNQYINSKMVELGMAWHFKKYSKDPKLAAIENTARINKKGLWSMQLPIAPWDYRAAKKSVKSKSAI
jgi:micrococcal nuclease